MSILIHSNYSPLTSHGGIEFVVSQIINVIKQLNLSATCFYGGNANERKCVEKIKYVPQHIVFKFHGAPILMLGNIKFLYYGLKSDLIIFQEPFPSLWPSIFFLKTIFRKKIIVLIHANPSASKPVKFLYNFIRSLVFRGSLCVTTSPNLLSQVNSSAYKECKLIPLCIPDISNCNPEEGINVPEKYGLYFGRLANYKGIETLITAARHSPKINFVIAGDGPLRSAVDEEVRASVVKNITFINRFITEEEKTFLINKSSFVIFPSTSQNEAFGLVQLEAMRAGKPLINTFLNTGVNFVAPHMLCALTVKPNSVTELSEAIHLLWESDSLVMKLGYAGNIRYKSMFSMGAFSSSWKEIIGSFLNDRK